MTHPTSTTSASSSTSQSGMPARPQRLRWHPARLLYVFLVTLLIGILFSEIQALLTDPSSVLDPTQARHTFFWNLVFAYPVFVAGAALVAIGAAILGWRLDQRYSQLQEET